MAASRRSAKARRKSQLKVAAFRESSTKEDARTAVILASKRALQKAHCDYCGYLMARGRLTSFDLSQDSSSSLLSHERAIRRGSRRGFNENNEVHSVTSFYSFAGSNDCDLTTIAETRVSTLSGQNNNNNHKEKKRTVFPQPHWNVFQKRRKRRKTNRGALASEITQEAWMCGVCAKSFASYEAADKHEDYHIKEVVIDLGWIRDSQAQSVASPPVNLSPFASGEEHIQEKHPGTTSIDNNNKEFHTPNLSSVSPPRPDVLTTSNPSRLTPYHVGFRDTDEIINTTNRLTSPAYPTATRPQRPPRTPEFSLMSAIEERDDENDLLVPYEMREYVVLADEALVDVCNKAESLVLTDDEVEAELELALLSKDKAHYDLIAERALKREQEGHYSRFRTEGKTMLNKVQNKFVDAYQLMKEGNAKEDGGMDHYNRKKRGNDDTIRDIVHNKRTLYVNVIVKQSIQVVRHELQRLAKKRWEDAQTEAKTTTRSQSRSKGFHKFRAAAQENLVKLAEFALALDFTPRRIAVQLSNDLYRLLTPRLKRRGVTLETEIEYRVGPYFVLAVNIKKIDWTRLLKMTHRDVAERRSKWKKKHGADDEEEDSKPSGYLVSFITLCYRLSRLTKYEVLAQVLAWLYFVHWTISTPLCFLAYHLFLGETFRTYFLSSVADEIFYYVEEKGMDMEVEIRDSATQAAFMLSALRELRADGRELKKKRQESETEAQGALLGPLLGPAIKLDNGPAPPKPEGFETPENLEFIGLELAVPVGFLRLRWALLHSKSTFMSEAVFRAEAKYDNITFGKWNKFDDVIGNPTLPDTIKEEDFIGAEREASYLMPKSAFVKANMCYETAYVEAYNNYCFSLKKKALTPEVPYGSTFVAWTKFVVINTGNEACKIICSVEPEFPNGPPMISRQIKSGMRAGVTELFVKIGETITKYADEFPS